MIGSNIDNVTHTITPSLLGHQISLKEDTTLNVRSKYAIHEQVTGHYYKEENGIKIIGFSFLFFYISFSNL
jgi:hypothetical protein